MNDIHEMLKITLNYSKRSNGPNYWNKNDLLTRGNFETGAKLVPVVQPTQASTALFCFSKKDCCIVRGFFTLTIIEIIVPNGLRFFQLTIQPLKQGRPSQNVAWWFLDIFCFRSLTVDDYFKKNLQNLVDIVKRSIYHGLNLFEFARELVPMEFDITMLTDSPCPDTSIDDDIFGREINPLRCDIQLSPLHVQRKRQFLCIEDGAVEVFDEKNEELNPKKR